MIDFKISFKADRLLYGDYDRMSLTSEIMFRKFLLQFKSKMALTPLQSLKTLCCQGNVSAIMNLAF